MSTHAYELVDGGRLDELPLDDAVRRWRDGDGAFWVDAGSLEPSSLAPVLDRLDVSEFLKRRCFRVGRSTIVLAAPNATFATLPLYADAGGTQRIYGAAVCLPRLLLTFRGGPVEDAEPRQMRLDELELEDGTTSGLLTALLVRRAAASAAVARELRDELTELGERMDESPTAVEPAELEKLKRRTSLFDAIVE